MLPNEPLVQVSDSNYIYPSDVTGWELGGHPFCEVFAETKYGLKQIQDKFEEEVLKHFGLKKVVTTEFATRTAELVPLKEPAGIDG